jgi:hypothetical protein
MFEYGNQDTNTCQQNKSNIKATGKMLLTVCSNSGVHKIP